MKITLIMLLLCFSSQSIGGSYQSCKVLAEVQNSQRKWFSLSKYTVTFKVLESVEYGDSWPCDYMKGKRYRKVIKLGKNTYKAGDAIELLYESSEGPFDSSEKYSLFGEKHNK